MARRKQTYDTMQQGLFGGMPMNRTVNYDEVDKSPIRHDGDTQTTKVRCCDCRRFVRDTEGPSFSVVTGEYFMGLCPKMHADGVTVRDAYGKAIGGKVFADKARECKDKK